jgi:hypothetical protein
MKNSTAVIREIINIILAFSVLHCFFRYFYHLSLWDVVRWWAFNFLKVENVGAYALSLFFGILVYLLIFSGFANTVYLGLFGEKQELVYLGNSQENTGAYYKRNDVHRTLLTGYDTEIVYNLSFDNLLRSQLFKKDSGTKNTVGTKNNRFTFLSYLSITCAMGFVLLAALGIFHTFAFQVYAANPTSVMLPHSEGAMVAFDSIIAHFHLTRGTYFLLTIALLLCFMGFAMANMSSGNKPGRRVEVLPSTIRPDSVIQGIPVEIKPLFVQRRRALSSSSSIDYEWVDSGDRYVNFKFSERFTQPVYVAAIIQAEDRRDLIGEVKENLSYNKPMNVKVGEYLNITIVRSV